jgi:hypothetical protein
MRGNAVCFSKVCIIRYTSHLNVTTVQISLFGAKMLVYWLCICALLQCSIHSNSSHVGWMIDRINWYKFESRHPKDDIAHSWYKMCFRLFTLCSLLCMPNSPLFGKTWILNSLYFYIPFTSSFTVKHSNCIFCKW